jgi:hypothetical protein
MQDNGFTLLGDSKYPESAREIAIPKYIAELFVNTENSGVTSVEQMIGKTVSFNSFEAIPSTDKFTVVGVYDVGTIPAKYD